MNLSEAEEPGPLQSGNHPQDAFLLAELEVILKPDQIVTVGALVFLPQLHDGIGPASGARVGQTDRLHRAKAQGVAPATGQLFDGEAGFKVTCVLEGVQLYFFGGKNRIDKLFVVVFRQRTVQVVFASLAVARSAEDSGFVQSGRVHNRTDGVVKIQMRRAGQPGDVFRQRAGGQRPGCHHYNPFTPLTGNLADLFTNQSNERISLNGFAYARCELLAINRQRLPARHRHVIRHRNQQRPGAAQLLFEQPRRGDRVIGLE